MAGSLDDQRVHLVTVPAGFQFLVTFSNHNGQPEARLQMNSVSTMTPVQVSKQLRDIADRIEVKNWTRKDTE